MNKSEKDKTTAPSFLKILGSTLAAAFGVQSRSKLEEDFQQSSPLPFIVAGILFTLVFVVTLVFIVKIVLRNAV
jgi:hypothetical protein